MNQSDSFSGSKIAFLEGGTFPSHAATIPFIFLIQSERSKFKWNQPINLEMMQWTYPIVPGWVYPVIDCLRAAVIFYLTWCTHSMWLGFWWTSSLTAIRSSLGVCLCHSLHILLKMDTGDNQTVVAGGLCTRMTTADTWLESLCSHWRCKLALL